MARHKQAEYCGPAPARVGKGSVEDHEKKVVDHPDDELDVLYGVADAVETFLLDFFIGSMALHLIHAGHELRPSGIGLYTGFQTRSVPRPPVKRYGSAARTNANCPECRQRDGESAFGQHQHLTSPSKRPNRVTES